MTVDNGAPDSRNGDEALVGGMVNAGTVFRRGSLVDRTAPRTAPALHAHLRALRRHGFEGAPLPVGLTPDGREQLTFVPGDVALPPFPPWALTESALATVGTLLRDLHTASAALPADPHVDWPRAPAAPGRPLWDVAMAARYRVPMLDPESAAALYPGGGLDAPLRLRVLADSYGLSAQERAELPDVIEQTTAVCRAFVAARVAEGDPVYCGVLAERGGWTRWDRVQTWLTTHHDAFTAALML